MSLNIKMEKKLKVKNELEKKLVKEGLTKKEKMILENLKTNINEAPIDYEGPERMDPNIERKITGKQTPYSEHPGLPKGDRDFVELVSSKRFKDSVETVRRYLGTTAPLQGANPLMQLMMMAMQSLQQVMRIEFRNKEYLENLAVDLVKKEMGIPDGAMQFDAKLIQGPLSSQEGMRTQPTKPKEEDVKKAFKHQDDIEEFVDEFEKFNLEKAKRRFINSLIQGASKKGHYMFELVRDELDRVDPRLLNLYGIVMSINDLMYWVLPDQMMDMMMSQQGVGGKEEVDIETDPPTVKARGLFFPILVHELIKGTMEVLGTQGLPDDPKQAEMVMASTDTLANEVWDLRLGPVLWEKFLAAYPERLFDEDKKFIQSYLFARFSALSADEFFKLAKMILRGDAKATSILDRMVTEIVNHLNDVHSDDDDESYDDDEDGDTMGPDDDDLSDLDDFLGSLGIDRA
jgi:hypothetical protein